MSGNPWSSDISEEKVCLSPDEFSINNSDDWTCALEKIMIKGVSLVLLDVIIKKNY